MDILELKKDMTQEELAEHLGVGRGKVCHMLREAREKQKVEYENRKTIHDNYPDLDDIFEQLERRKELFDHVSTKQTEVTIGIKEEKHFGVVWWGDHHVGHVGVDYKAYRDDTLKIRDTEGLYVMGAGDYRENAIKHRGSHFGEIVPPDIQRDIVSRNLIELREKMLVMIAGCHDSWEKAYTATDFMEELCDVTDSAYLWHGGEVTIRTGEVDYLWRVRHKYPYQSSLNLENAMRRINELQGPCDVAAEAHLHNDFIMMRPLMGEYRVLMRSGTYKVWDDHCQKQAGWKGYPQFPMVIMSPHKRELVVAHSIDAGIKILKGLRG